MGLLQLVLLHAVDRSCSARWALPMGAPHGGPPQGGLALGIVSVLGPLVLGLQRQAASGAPRWHTRALGGPFGGPVTPPEIGGPLAEAGSGPPETGGALGFGCRRLLETFSNDPAAVQVSLGDPPSRLSSL